MNKVIAMDGLRWSPHPIEAYVRTIEGKLLGPGANPALVTNLAAWNIYWLTFPHLEQHTDLEGGQSAICPDALAEPAIRTAAQYAGAARVGDLSLHMTPDAFVTEIGRREIAHLPIVHLFGRELWLASMRARIYKFLGARRSDLDFDLTSQQNGTDDENSTNILPLVKLFH